jgi:hypothetical protein
MHSPDEGIVYTGVGVEASGRPVMAGLKAGLYEYGRPQAGDR